MRYQTCDSNNYKELTVSNDVDYLIIMAGKAESEGDFNPETVIVIQ
jgi:hypothetical protein